MLIHSYKTGKSNHQELEGVGLITSTVRSREQLSAHILALGSISLHVHTSGSFAYGMVSPAVGGDSVPIKPNAHKSTCSRKFLIVSSFSSEY